MKPSHIYETNILFNLLYRICHFPSFCTVFVNTSFWEPMKKYPVNTLNTLHETQLSLLNDCIYRPCHNRVPDVIEAISRYFNHWQNSVTWQEKFGPEDFNGLKGRLFSDVISFGWDWSQLICFLQCISCLCSCLYLIQCLTARSDYPFPLKVKLFLPPAIILNDHEEPIFKFNLCTHCKRKIHSTEYQPMNSTESCDC